MTDTTTREFCQRCQRVSPIGFFSPHETWKLVAGSWADSILCVMCFAALGDEKHVRWEEDIEFFPVSYATLHAMRGPRLVAQTGEWWAEIKGWHDDVGGFIPHSALEELGIRMGEGTTWLTKEQSAAIRRHPRFETTEQWRQGTKLAADG